MRRSLLTAGPNVPAVPVSVGNTGTFGTSSIGVLRSAVDISDAATATSTVTTVALQCNTAGTIYVMVGSLAGLNYTIRSISGALTAAVGLNNLSVSLPVVAGDFIGYWTPTTTGAVGRYSTGSVGFNTGYNLSLPGSVPSPGAVVTLTTDASTRLSVLGTG